MAAHELVCRVELGAAAHWTSCRGGCGCHPSVVFGWAGLVITGGTPVRLAARSGAEHGAPGDSDYQRDFRSELEQTKREGRPFGRPSRSR